MFEVKDLLNMSLFKLYLLVKRRKKEKKFRLHFQMPTVELK